LVLSTGSAPITSASYTGNKFGGEDGIRTRKDRDDLGITRRLAAGLKCASLLDLPWLFRCFCKDPSSDLARPGFTRAGFPTFPGELAELAQLPQNWCRRRGSNSRPPLYKSIASAELRRRKFTNAGVAAGNRKIFAA
jgi:hypothetical protein